MMLLSILVLLIGYVITGYFLFHGTFFPSQDSPIVVASFVGTYASLFAVALFWIVFAVERRLHSIKSTSSKPSFIKLAYRSFKDKVCC